MPTENPRNPKVRNPNTGPYVVQYRGSAGSHFLYQECPTWSDACAVMRHFLVNSVHDMTVRFA